MARLSLNVDQETFDSAGRTFQPVPVGDYEVTIFAVSDDTVKNKDSENFGKLRLKFQFRIADGAESPDGQNQGNRRLFADINAFPGKDKKTGKETPSYDLVAIGKAIGLTPEQLKNIDTDEWQGESLQVSVTHRRKQEKVGNVWVDIEPAEFRENVRGFRSLDSVATSVAAKATVTRKAPTGAKAGAKTGFTL